MNKLLVVDDDGAIRRMIRLNLAATHEVLVTAEPETCAERIDIITTTAGKPRSFVRSGTICITLDTGADSKSGPNAGSCSSSEELRVGVLS